MNRYQCTDLPAWTRISTPLGPAHRSRHVRIEATDRANEVLVDGVRFVVREVTS